MTKIGFGRLVNVLTIWGMRELEDHEMVNLEQLVNSPPPICDRPIVSEGSVCELLEAMKNSRKIEAIRAYRILTNAGLKESKDAIEKYL